MHKLLPLLIVLSFPGLAQAGPDDLTAAGKTSHAVDPWEKRINAEGILELEWEDLVPVDFDPDTLFASVAGRYGLEELDDNDPRARQVMAEVEQIWHHAPAVASLDGRRVKLPGLVIPLEGDATKMSEFLLVPYYGACIHVPPPPSNQIVYVKTGAKKAHVEKMFDAVWVTGTLRSQHQRNAVGEASYTLEAQRVESYE
jgi:hypothetical protein